MRILILMDLVSPATGAIADKVYTQCRELSALGHEIKYLPPEGRIHQFQDRFAPYLLKDSSAYFRLCERHGNHPVQKIKCLHFLFRLLVCADTDIIYFRYTPAARPLLALLMSGRPFVQEHNTFEYSELRKLGYQKAMLADITLGKLARRRARALVGVTGEILSYQQRKAGTRKPGMIISNSIDMSCVSFAGRSLPNRKRLVFLGALDYWQGVDRAITLMEKLEDFQLSIIGDGRERKSLEDLVNTRNLSGRVVFKGILKGPALQDELRQHDIGIASLGVHRKDLTEACPLKTRHYLALGMPVIIGYHDVDLANDLPFVLKVPCNESPIDADSVRDFYFRLVNDSDIIKTIQTYANENLSSRRKMKTLSGFLAQVAHTRAAVTAS